MKSMKVCDHFGTNTNIGVNNEFICGVEYEVEDIHDITDQVAREFCIEEDHSLRNNGKEFKTEPETFDEALNSFISLFDGLVLGPKAFSDRTSTHVHVNVTHMTMKQVRELLLTYALVEPILFDFVGPYRKNNIYCVPLNYTHLPNSYSKPLQTLHNKWSKYTALNLKPLSQYGTVEFRHLYGTNNLETFTLWLTTLKELFEIVQSPSWNVVKLMEKTPVVDLVKQIIPTLSKNYSDSTMEELVKDTMLDVKLSVGGLK